jgi:hypothetical protein
MLPPASPRGNIMLLKKSVALIILMLCVVACTPTVKLEAPTDPITINLNVKIEHDIYIKVDKQLDTVLDKSSGLF